MRSLGLVLACAVAGCGDDGAASIDAAPEQPGDIVTYDVTTSNGAFAIETHRAWAPNGVDHFRELVDAKFYDGARFFRVVPNFVVQFGINGTPAIDAMWNDRTITDDPVVKSNLRGYLTYAQTSQPNSRSTQLFVNFVDNKFLDTMRFAPFAQVTSGMDVVDAINAEYGEAPDQQAISAQGDAYLEANFPRLDYIVSIVKR